jgi:hypothetical protein
MRICLAFFFTMICAGLKAQSIPFDKFSTDTLHLTPFTAKKIVAYTLNSITFYVDYNDYKKDLRVFWKRYNSGMKTKLAPNEKPNPDYNARWLTIDSIHTLLKTLVKKQDTIWLNQKTFDKVGLRQLCDFTKLIENNKCSIANNKGELQYIIIRKKGEWYRGPLNAWGGRRYFFPGDNNFFIDGTDWIS